MATTKAQQKAVAKYESKAYDKTLIRMPKGYLPAVKVHATERGETLNGFINRAITETIQRDNSPAQPIAVKQADEISDDNFRKWVNDLREQRKANNETRDTEQEESQ